MQHMQQDGLHAMQVLQGRRHCHSIIPGDPEDQWGPGAMIGGRLAGWKSRAELALEGSAEAPQQSTEHS